MKNFYSGDVVEPIEGTFGKGWTCPIDMVNDSYVRLAIDGVFGHRRWIDKSSVILRKRPLINTVRDFCSSLVSNTTNRLHVILSNLFR